MKSTTSISFITRFFVYFVLQSRIRHLHSIETKHYGKELAIIGRMICSIDSKWTLPSTWQLVPLCLSLPRYSTTAIG